MVKRVHQNPTMAKIGYARISTAEQTLDLQRDALTGAGCTEVIEDLGLSGARRDRPGLERALGLLAPDDVLVVWKLDRLGRSLPHLIEILDTVGKRGAGFQSLTEMIDTTTAGGRLIFHVMGALATFERDLIAERTKEGMSAARRRGRHVGRPRLLDPHQVETARHLIESGRETQAGAAAVLGVSVSTLRRALNATARRAA